MDEVIPIRVRATKQIDYWCGGQWHSSGVMIPEHTIGTLLGNSGSHPSTGTPLMAVRWDYALVNGEPKNGHVERCATNEIAIANDASPFLIIEQRKTNALLERLVNAIEGYTSQR